MIVFIAGWEGVGIESKEDPNDADSLLPWIAKNITHHKDLPMYIYVGY